VAKSDAFPDVISVTHCYDGDPPHWCLGQPGFISFALICEKDV
jgi:hypothetical protein